MIDRKDLKVGLVTECDCKITAIGQARLLYEYNGGEYPTYINDFCSKYSIKKEKVEIVRWVNIYPDDFSSGYPTKAAAKHYADHSAIAVAVKMVGSYEI